MNGILNLCKPAGMSSSEVVSRARRILGEKKIGHLGTLDPAAAGVLPLLVGQATRLFDYLSLHRKRYRFEVTFGVETDTLDAEGQITLRMPQTVDSVQLEAVLPRFLGEIDQLPPIFSAIHVKGAKAYKLARGGQEVSLPTRKVCVESLTLLRTDGHKALLEMDCSMGTYVRSLARDLAQACGTCGHVSYLLRSRCGEYALEDSLTLAELAACSRQGDVPLQSMDQALHGIPELELDLPVMRRARNGIYPPFPSTAPEGEPLRLKCDGQLWGIGQSRLRNGTLLLVSDLWLQES